MYRFVYVDICSVLFEVASDNMYTVNTYTQTELFKTAYEMQRFLSVNLCIVFNWYTKVLSDVAAVTNQNKLNLKVLLI